MEVLPGVSLAAPTGLAAASEEEPSGEVAAKKESVPEMLGNFKITKMEVPEVGRAPALELLSKEPLGKAFLEQRQGVTFKPATLQPLPAVPAIIPAPAAKTGPGGGQGMAAFVVRPKIGMGYQLVPGLCHRGAETAAQTQHRRTAETAAQANFQIRQTVNKVNLDFQKLMYRKRWREQSDCPTSSLDPQRRWK
ncbi:unnamed protein product [Amoebophrya sp. A25]|nr:unnamed protein product [Amoebophrya sp. A25]|eukprot:GSA25T00017342001.1